MSGDDVAAQPPATGAEPDVSALAKGKGKAPAGADVPAVGANENSRGAMMDDDDDDDDDEEDEEDPMVSELVYHVREITN